MKLNDDFMKHFRWITPLLLAFAVFMLQSIYADFKELKQDMFSVKIDIAVLKVSSGKK